MLRVLDREVDECGETVSQGVRHLLLQKLAQVGHCVLKLLSEKQELRLHILLVELSKLLKHRFETLVHWLPLLCQDHQRILTLLDSRELSDQVIWPFKLLDLMQDFIGEYLQRQLLPFTFQ